MHLIAQIVSLFGVAAGVVLLMFSVTRVLNRVHRRQSSWTRRWQRVAMRPVRWRFALAMAAASAWAYVVLFGAVQAGWLVPVDIAPDAGLLPLAAQTLPLPLAALTALAVCMHAEGASARRAFGLQARQRRAGARQAPLLYLAALPVVLAAALAWRAVLDGLAIPLAPQPLIELLQSGRLSPYAVLYISVLAVTVAPITEELLFRGLLLPLLMRHYGPVQAVTAVSLMFACIHFNAASIAPLFAIAAAFALGYLWTGSLLTAILMHALFNGVNLLLLTLAAPQAL